ncbi:MAG: hypothetical protein COV66_09035 [Nitrospinae bacterium CG11_big_fil_rev_8_21_14_0_20_45_15]|nr:MAG: hypothetical protein COV66_09035 [Nitrospinae bacterium CG11_big_fil_rev_8_21_14_0_20_45_15]
MSGSHQIQLRHIVVEKETVANLLKETIDSLPSAKDRVQMLMRLAEKYSICESKDDGGNLGWIELDWEKVSPGSLSSPAGEYFTLANHELETIVREASEKMTLLKGILFGPVKTSQGYHLVLISQEYATRRL